MDDDFQDYLDYDPWNNIVVSSTAERQLHFVSEGDVEIKLPSGSVTVPLEKLPSGHLAMVIDDYERLQAQQGGVQTVPMQLHANMPEHITNDVPMIVKGTNGYQAEGKSTTTVSKEPSSHGDSKGSCHNRRVAPGCVTASLEVPCPTVPENMNKFTCECGDRDCAECGRLFHTLPSTIQQ